MAKSTAKFKREYPIKELRERVPTCNFRWNKAGQLEQKWLYHWAIWESEMSVKWWHDYENVWVKVPTVQECGIEEHLKMQGEK